MTEVLRFGALSVFRSRASVVGPLILVAILYLVELSFWSFTVQRSELHGYPGNSIISYAAFSILLFQLTAPGAELDRLTEDVESGAIDLVLLRPMSLPAYFLLYQLGQTIGRTLIYAPVLCLLFLHFGTPPGWNLVAGFVLLAVGACMNALTSIALASLAFRFMESYAFVAVKDTFMWIASGALMPINLFPAWFARALLLLPFPYAAYVPAKLFSGSEFDPSTLVLALIVLAYTYVIATRSWRAGMKRYEGAGAYG